MIDKRTTFCICDFETTGVDPERDLPIEVGCIFTDSQFAIHESYSALIGWPNLMQGKGWDQEAQEAHLYHRISHANYATMNIDHKEVVRDIQMICKRVGGGRTVTILSDNVQFEFRFMLKLFTDAEWPFHYCGWDSSLLLEMTGVGDPEPEHRALRDAALLHTHLIRAQERVEWAKSNR